MADEKDADAGEALWWDVRAEAIIDAGSSPDNLAVMGVPMEPVTARRRRWLLSFASTCFIPGHGDSSKSTEPLNRSDALPFAVTIFATVGFGDISA